MKNIIMALIPVGVKVYDPFSLREKGNNVFF